MIPQYFKCILQPSAQIYRYLTKKRRYTCICWCRGAYRTVRGYRNHRYGHSSSPCTGRTSSYSSYGSARSYSSDHSQGTSQPLKQMKFRIVKASAHSFKQFTSRLLKSNFSLSMHIYNSDGRHAWFHLHGASRPARSGSEATKYKMKNFLSIVGFEPTTLRFKVWCSTDWASRAWWMLSI